MCVLMSDRHRHPVRGERKEASQECRCLHKRGREASIRSSLNVMAGVLRVVSSLCVCVCVFWHALGLVVSRYYVRGVTSFCACVWMIFP